MNILKDILPMTTFRNHSAHIMQHLKKTKRPVILTVNGKAAAVVQDAEAYQHLLDLAAEASAAEGIRQGLEDLKRSQTRPASEVFGELRSTHGIPR
ncbi:MAG: type II toxin-antitoxin system Phd/YefM family antitoxin [Methylocella sp.]